MPPLSQARIVVILLYVPVTLLLLKNNQIPLHQFLNFVLFLLNHPRSRTILFGMTAHLFYAIADASATNISSVISVSIIFVKMSFLIILNNPSHSDSASKLFS